MKAREVNRRIEAKGGQHVRTVGSHKRYRVTVGGITASTAVPQHPGDIPTGTLRNRKRPGTSIGTEMALVSCYKVVVTREGGSWLADVPAVPGAHTFARSLTGLAKSVREVIILMADLDDHAKPELTFTYQVSDEVVQEAVAVGRERRQARELEEALMAHTSAAVARLAREGYSVRDAAALLDLTPGRVSQLLNA
jgi:predicted RNA binding protein YcfA (HicA-like mRNA interferase family)/predicted RNase H-like HicB family nuclease